MKTTHFRRPLVKGLLMCAALLAPMSLSSTWSSFSANVVHTGTLASTTADAYLPSSATVTRDTLTTCSVTYIPHPQAPLDLVYEVWDGTNYLSTTDSNPYTLTVSTNTTQLYIKTRLGTWLSSSSTATSTACPAMATVPSSPGLQYVYATSTVGDSAYASWTIPNSDGGSTIDSYTAQLVDSLGAVIGSCTTAQTHCTFTGLAGNATKYTLSVTAHNALGYSSPSTSLTYWAGIPSPTSAKLWLDAADLDADKISQGPSESTLIGGLVNVWKDKSGNGNDVSATDASLRPSYSSTLNGINSVTFNGTTQLNQNSANPYGINSDRSIFLVTQVRSIVNGNSGAGDGTYLLDRTPENTGLFSFKACSNTYSIQIRNDGGGGLGCVSSGYPLTSKGPILLSGLRSGTNVYTAAAGGSQGSGTLSGATTAAGLSVGRHSISAIVGQDLDVAEVLVYDKALAESEQRAVEVYLSQKWALPLAPAPVSSPNVSGTGTVTVSWVAPSDPGSSPITSYQVNISGGATCSATPPTTQCTISGLTPGQNYTGTITASNNAWFSKVSTFSFTA